MSVRIFASSGGEVVLPEAGRALVHRQDGGHLIVNPPRPVWERSELAPVELMRWSALVASAGRAMLDVLPQLAGGCINYWEAGNWALHEAADPAGPKTAPQYRRVHLHLLGRSRTAAHPAWQWGEAPAFPRFRDRHAWASAFEPLTAAECDAIAARIGHILGDVYGDDTLRADDLRHGRDDSAG